MHNKIYIYLITICVLMNVTYQEQRHDLTTDEGKTGRHQERTTKRCAFEYYNLNNVHNVYDFPSHSHSHAPCVGYSVLRIQ